MSNDSIIPALMGVVSVIMAVVMVFSAGYGVGKADHVKDSACRSGYVYVLVEDKDGTRTWSATQARCEEEKQ